MQQNKLFTLLITYNDKPWNIKNLLRNPNTPLVIFESIWNPPKVPPIVYKRYYREPLSKFYGLPKVVDKYYNHINWINFCRADNLPLELLERYAKYGRNSKLNWKYFVVILLFQNLSLRNI